MDSVSDALIRIKNGYMANKKEIRVKRSKLTLNICQLLLKEGYIENLKQEGREISVYLRYNGKIPALSDIKRVSKPSLRVYKGVRLLPRVLGGLGVAIVSTPKGLMTDKEARKLGVGGEVMVEVW